MQTILLSLQEARKKCERCLDPNEFSKDYKTDSKKWENKILKEHKFEKVESVRYLGTIFARILSVMEQQSESANFLGTAVDGTLSFVEDCNSTSKRTTTCYYMIYNLRKVVAMEGLKAFYYATDESRLRYGYCYFLGSFGEFS